MLKKIGLTLAAVVVLLAIVSFFLPSTVRVERSTVVNASTETVFNQVNSFKAWESWSPWKEQDPGMKNEYSGPDAGAGAVSTWKSEKMGEGSQTIVSSAPYSAITTELDFGKDSKPNSHWKFEETPEGTKVSWDFEMELGMNPVMRYMGVMMKGTIGEEYEKGLSNLKKVCESMPAPTTVTETTNPTPTEVTTKETPQLSTTTRETTVATE